MTRRLLVLGAAVAVLSTACGSQPATSSSGIEGTVTVGPTCPVERLASPCPERPISRGVSVQDRSGRQVAHFTTGADGRFRVALAPGTYTVVGDRNGILPRPIPTTATVREGQYTHVDVRYDSGIR